MLFIFLWFIFRRNCSKGRTFKLCHGRHFAYFA